MKLLKLVGSMEKIPPRLLLLLCKIVVDEFKNGWNTSKGDVLRLQRD
jgi:hypothetical protein